MENKCWIPNRFVRQIIESKQSSNWTYDLDSLQLLAPIPRPGKIADHGGKSLYMRNASIGQTQNYASDDRCITLRTGHHIYKLDVRKVDPSEL